MNKIWQSVGILFLLNAAIIGFAFVYENAIAPTGGQTKNSEDGFRFITLSEIITPKTISVNDNAEQIVKDLLKSDTLKITLLKKRGTVDSAFLDKPGDTTVKNNKILNPDALDAFFEALIQEKDDALVRVAHYGDSQLEGDRVTVHIRKNLQAKFGGGGLGYVPLDDIASNGSYSRTNRGTWKRYNVFNKRLKQSSFYGLSGYVYRFAKGEIIPDSIITASPKDSLQTIQTDSANSKPIIDTIPLIVKVDSTKTNTHTTKTPKRIDYTKNASVTYRFYKRRKIKYSTVSLMYGRTTEGFGIKCYTLANKLIYADTLKAELGYANKKLNIPAGLKGFKIEFFGKHSPDLYGLQIDDTAGIIVDNYAIRGHSGNGLFRINDEYLSKQIAQTNTRLIIFQYGANMLPYLDSEKECKTYENSFYRLFMKFKKAAPNASILVIGNGDMGYKKSGEEKSYPYVRCLSDIQKSAAKKAGCSFWSLLDAMGGDNAILSWKRKGLCMLDGHLTPKGQRIMANLIFRAIMREYNNYVIKQQNS